MDGVVSSTVIHVGRGRIEKGELKLAKTDDLREAVSHCRDCVVMLTLERVTATRSLPQNAYYWSVVVELVAKKYTESRKHRPFSPKETHEILKAQFFDPNLVLEGLIPGQIINGLCIGVSTTDLNKLQFIEYLERIVWWAAEKMDLYIPDPDPDWKLKAQQEAAAA